MDARKSKYGANGVRVILKEVDEVIAAKGKRVVRLDLRKARPGPGEIESLLLGPTGNLRAPALRVGRVLVVGFHPDAFGAALEGKR